MKLRDLVAETISESERRAWAPECRRKTVDFIFLLSLALMFAVYYFDKPTFWVSSVGLGVMGVSWILGVANIFESIVEEGFDHFFESILNGIFG